MEFLTNNPALKKQRRELRHNQTDAERVFWWKVRNRQFYGLKFYRQYSVGSYILDFYCPAIKVAVELDGGQHNQPRNSEHDVVRSEYLNACGVNVVRFWNHEVLSDIESVFVGLEEIVMPLLSPELL